MPNTVSDTIDDETLSCAIQIESAGKPNARATTSSATGLGQFIKRTWWNVIDKHRPDLAKRYTRDQLLNLRTNPSLSIEMLARLWEDNAAIVGNASAGDLYLAHFLGAGTARKLFRAIETSPVSSVVGADQIKANRSILEGKTCKQVRDWATRKMASAGGKNWVQRWYDPNEPLLAHNSFPPTPETDEDPIPDDVTAHKIDEADEHNDDPTPHGKVNDEIASVQSALVEMGYNEVGLIDGAWGGGTKAGVAAFLNDQGRDDLLPEMSPEVVALISAAQLRKYRRNIAPERANVQPKDLAPYNPTIRSTMRQKLAAWIGGGTGTVVAIFNGVSSYFTSVWDYIAPLRNAMAHVPWFVWVALAIAACVALYYNADTAEKDTTDAFKSRRLLR